MSPIMVNPSFGSSSDISISEDPSLSFSFRQADAASPGVIEAKMLDSNQRRFGQAWPVPAAPHM